MTTPSYDDIADDYAAWVDTALQEPNRTIGVAAACLLALAGAVAGRDVCDLGCGEGHVARLFAASGAQVVGVDISARLLEIARHLRYFPTCTTFTMMPNSLSTWHLRHSTWS